MGFSLGADAATGKGRLHINSSDAAMDFAHALALAAPAKRAALLEREMGKDHGRWNTPWFVNIALAVLDGAEYYNLPMPAVLVEDPQIRAMATKAANRMRRAVPLCSGTFGAFGEALWDLVLRLDDLLGNQEPTGKSEDGEARRASMPLEGQ